MKLQLCFTSKNARHWKCSSDCVPMIPYPYILAIGEDRYQSGTNGGNNKEVILCKWNYILYLQRKKNELHITLCDKMKNMGQIPNWLGNKNSKCKLGPLLAN